MRSIAIVNQKGGTGKTTTALATAWGLAGRGYRVLLIDLDQQHNATTTLGADPRETNIVDVLTGHSRISEAINRENAVHLVPGTAKIGQLEQIMSGMGEEAMTALSDALEEVQASYDFVVIDTPPAMGLPSVNALTAASSVVVPLNADIYGLYAMEKITRSVADIQSSLNPGLEIEGFLFTEYDKRTRLARDMRQKAEQAAEALGTKVFNTSIRKSVAVVEALAMRRDLFEYAPKATVTQDYGAYIDELLEGIEQ